MKKLTFMFDDAKVRRKTGSRKFLQRTGLILQRNVYVWVILTSEVRRMTADGNRVWGA